MNTEEIPKKCTVNSFFFFFFQSTSLLLFLPIPSSCFWLNQTPLASCTHVPSAVLWFTTLALLHSAGQSPIKKLLRAPGRTWETLFFPRCTYKPFLLEILLVLAYQLPPLFSEEANKTEPSTKSIWLGTRTECGEKQDCSILQQYTARGAEAVSSSHKGCKTQQGGSPAEPDLETACSHLNSSQSFCYSGALLSSGGVPPLHIHRSSSAWCCVSANAEFAGMKPMPE